MSLRERISPLRTDLYELTMMQGYFDAGYHNHDAIFDLFFRKIPFEGGYVVLTGLEEALYALETLHFNEEEIDYLHGLNLFTDDFLQYLKDFRFTCRVDAISEGTVVFPHEPVMRVTGPLPQAQLVEPLLLNIINFQSLIATRAARLRDAAGSDSILEFGLRRAQGPDGALSAARAAYTGGVAATSNVEAGKKYGIPVKGTHAHSWVTAFPDELSSFRAFVRSFPGNSILLVDTYDTLESGIPNAIRIGLEMKERGEKLMGVRLDSGDLAYLSVEARRMLDEAGLNETKIVASNELDENIILDMNRQGALIDLYGVGTRLVTANDDPALSGVYKLAAIRPPDSEEWIPKVKVSEGKNKSTLPGLKQVYRLRGESEHPVGDLIEMEDQPPDFHRPVEGVHPQMDYHRKVYRSIRSAEPLLKPMMREGKRVVPERNLQEIRDFTRKQVESLHPTHRRLLRPHIYKVSLGPHLARETYRLRQSSLEEYGA